MDNQERGIRRTQWNARLLAIGVAMAAAVLGRFPVTAAPPTAAATPAAPLAPAASAESDYSRRVVAYVRGVAITREELGEYLIAREGADKIDLLVNKKIIEMYCKDRGVVVTQAEVDAALAQDVQGLGVNLGDFVGKVLKRYGKTLYEWKEDVIKPRLALTKLCRDRVEVTEKDIQDAFDAKYGESVEGRIILFPRDQQRQAMGVYEKVRWNEEDFNRAARQQASTQLAAQGGKVRPITRHSTGNDKLEKEAFSLKPGEVSALIETPEGYVVMKCDKRNPPDPSKKLDSVRAELKDLVLQKKIEAEIPKFFKEIRDQAQPNIILKTALREEDLIRAAQKELADDPHKGRSGQSGSGN
jgi:parvulin-like peptidyl-prolyl isomerase